MVTNPLDLMTYHMWKVTGFPKERIIGQAGVLDSARMTHFVAKEVGCNEEDVQAMVLGGHGDTMVPLPRYTTCGGIPILNYSMRKQLRQLVKELLAAAGR